MIEIITGIIFIAISSGLIYLVWLVGGNMIFLSIKIIILSCFLLLGVYFVIGGIIKLFRNFTMTVGGKKTYGCVTRVYHTGEYVTERAELYADVVAINKNDVIKTYTDSIGTDWNLYRDGDFVKIKQLGNDIKILKIADPQDVPYQIKNRLASHAKAEALKKGR